MKAFFGLRLAIVVGVSLWALGCADSTSTTDSTQVQIYTQLEGRSVTPSSIKNDYSGIAAKGVVADSLRISRVRILVSDIKMHTSKEDSIHNGHSVKVGPFLVTIDTAGLSLNASSPIPAGIYDHIKFEIHRFSSSEVANYLNDPVYSDFVTGDRYTIIIDGTVYDAGVAYPFEYKSKATINFWLKFANDIEIKQNVTNGIILFMNPSLVFRTGISVLDPRDPNNSNDIDQGLKWAFRALKR